MFIIMILNIFLIIINMYKIDISSLVVRREAEPYLIFLKCAYGQWSDMGTPSLNSVILGKKIGKEKILENYKN